MIISIIIPVYNTEKYLAKCLDSVIAQSFKDWECLLVNDGSTDQSKEICDRFAETDKRFSVFHTINSGVSAARNLGVNHAAGSYLAFIDSDDWVDDNYLSELYRAIANPGVELSVCGMKWIRPSGTEINQAEGSEFDISRENSDRFVELNRKFLLYGPVVKLYRTDIVKNKNIKFPEGIHYGEDLIFNFDYLENITKISVVGSSGYNYRITNGGSLSTSVHSRQFTNNYKQWNIIKSFFEKRGIESESAHRFLSDRIWGIAYNLVMGEKLSTSEIQTKISKPFVSDLKNFSNFSIPIPGWLRVFVKYRLAGLIWLVQRRSKNNLTKPAKIYIQ